MTAATPAPTPAFAYGDRVRVERLSDSAGLTGTLKPWHKGEILFVVGNHGRFVAGRVGAEGGVVAPKSCVERVTG